MYRQRIEHRPLADSTTTEYRYCLDGLLATIEDLKHTQRIANTAARVNDSATADRALWSVNADIVRAEARAADLAHRLFERWIIHEPDWSKVAPHLKD